ncbi:replicative DNA helicase [Nostoc sp. 'Peltigera membranacea cyanobiont' N6]|uniref:replicative DNA helicase n=1 Tax=Nostoc sp. 'Peltigera membranacea cyanobiont' N6 TaxID=1261031 RepID=UPI000CF30BAD|nr:replicative DNA helicase [Nostoc sp. 'Peltigera membranacea cyanobiont' N6]AVH62842.1 replicative DNA helicase DnaB precursor [Nostoc sp. 'Peltigera membranacea cyanobiont' N6]
MAEELNFKGDGSDRLPPQNIEAEEAILGGILLDPEAISRVSDRLLPEAFYISAHKEIYQAAVRLHAQGKPTDMLSVTSWLTDHDLLARIGGRNKLATLVDRTVSAVNIDGLAGLVTEKYLRRQLIKAGNEIVHLGYETETELSTVLDQAEQKVFGVTQERPQSGLVHISDTLINNFQDIEDRNQGIALPGIPCGFYDLDAMTSGFQRSDLIIVAGRPSMGKTAFCLNLAHNIAASYKLPVAFFSLEMSKEQLTQRLLASEAQIESSYLRTGRLSQTQWEPLSRAIGILSEMPIYIDDTPNITVTQMRSQARRLQAEVGTELGLIVIDYLQLMEGAGDNRVQELSKITRQLKGLARELSVPVIALSQLSRGVEARTNKRPMLSDLRESGCLTGDTLVTLADNGLQVPIRELAGKSGFAVWALNEATMQLEKAIVSNAFSTGIKPVFTLITRLGRKIRATVNHKFLTINGWKRLDELTPKEHLCLPRHLPSPGKQTMTYAEVALLGHLIGDGCTLPRHAIQYTTREIDLAQNVTFLAREVFGDSIVPRISPERSWYQVYLSAAQNLTHRVRNPIAKWLDSLGVFGLRSYEKFVPQELFSQPQESIGCFLRHLWSTDGCIKLVAGKNLRPIAYYATSSQRLAFDIQTLLLRLGINATLRIVSQVGKGRNQYHVIITGKPDLQLFIIHVGAVGEYKLRSLQDIFQHLENSIHNPNRDVIPKDVWKIEVVPAMQAIGFTTRILQASIGVSHCGSTLYKLNLSRERCLKVGNVVQSSKLVTLAKSDVYWDEILSIEYGGEEEVFDLTVPGLHNFVANNIIVHNSIEQDADLVIMLYRDEYYSPDTPDRGIAEVIIAKHRNGPTGTAKLLFNPQFTKFQNLKI